MRRLVALVGVLVTLLAACGSGGKHSAPPPAPSTTTRLVSTTTTVPFTKYMVKRGDTLSAIAHRFHVSSADLERINHIANPDFLHEGDTLLIPPATPLELTVTPVSAPQGQSFAIRLKGAQSGETITFEVDSPKGKFTGPPHVADVHGSVSAEYVTSISDVTGSYKVVAHGDQGTTAQTTFALVANSEHT